MITILCDKHLQKYRLDEEEFFTQHPNATERDFVGHQLIAVANGAVEQCYACRALTDKFYRRG